MELDSSSLVHGSCPIYVRGRQTLWEPSWPFLPRNMRNIPAARGAGQGFIVPAEYIVRPAGKGIDGWIRGV